MATLLLRLAAPLQAWGADSKFETRKTGREPTKSGVIGLLAAALGLRRDEREALLRLTGLRFGVRVEREGQLLVDYHTAKTQDEKTSYVTYRHYLQDAVFLAGIESTDTALLQQLQQALLHPVFPLYLGRRCCPPTLPLCLGVRPGSLQEVLQAEPPLCPGRQSRILLDADPLEPGTAPQRDVPVSFDPHHRPNTDAKNALRSECASFRNPPQLRRRHLCTFPKHLNCPYNYLSVLKCLHSPAFHIMN